MAKSHSPKRNREKFEKMRHKFRERRDPRKPGGEHGPTSLTYYACDRKVRFSSIGAAISKGRAQMNFYGKQLYYYPCAFCKGFHLTHKPGNTSVEIKEKY